jgi:predicted nucleic acid-binding Zn ribbon protein
MNKCQHCGAFVPVEKAFCPNCSEPMEPEEAPNRAASSSSDMMATLRDDPAQYKELLDMLKKKKSAAAGVEAPTPAPDSARAAPSVVAFSAPSQVAADVAPPAKNKSNLALIIGAVSILILLFVLLLIFKVI